ncbi:MAG: hypothetical protein KKB79_02010, partial [Nanoarchaeota archaeon]|nr:hypothetical protein [Nanoarchaeota archaeon]
MLENTKGKLALGQIVILLVGLFAFSYLISLDVGVVGGQGEANTLGDSLPQLPISPDQLKEGTLTDKSFQTKDGKSYILEGGKWILAVKGAEVTKAPKTGVIGKAIKFLSPSTKGGFWNPEGLDTALKYSGIGSAVIGVTKAILVFRSTGDSTRARDAGLRVGGSAFAGYWAGTGISSGLVALGWIGVGPAGWFAMGGTALAMWGSKYLTRETDRQIIFECKPWQAQSKGENCGLCNDGDFPCMEYQCKSLGAGCGLINKDTDDERCIWKNEKDLTAPEISADESSLEDGYRYDELSDGSGVEVNYGNEECLPAFKPFELQLNLDKEGYCKMSFDRTDSFSDMEIDFGGNQYKKEHIQRLTFPGA